MDRNLLHSAKLLRDTYNLVLYTFRNGGIHNLSEQPISVPHHPESKAFLTKI